MHSRYCSGAYVTHPYLIRHCVNMTKHSYRAYSCYITRTVPYQKKGIRNAYGNTTRLCWHLLTFIHYKIFVWSPLYVILFSSSLSVITVHYTVNWFSAIVRMHKSTLLLAKNRASFHNSGNTFVRYGRATNCSKRRPCSVKTTKD